MVSKKQLMLARINVIQLDFEPEIVLAEVEIGEKFFKFVKIGLA